MVPVMESKGFFMFAPLCLMCWAVDYANRPTNFKENCNFSINPCETVDVNGLFEK